MKKIFLITIFSILLLTGCSKQDELICEIGDTTVTITLKKGKIIHYSDKIKGDTNNSGIKQLNDNYLKDINNNEDAIDKLKNIFLEMDGSCNITKTN